MWFPTSPLQAIRARAPEARVEYDSGSNPAAAAALARTADIAIVFVCQWESEGMDLPSVALPGKQDALVEEVAAANSRTIVVLETGAPALMPWANEVSGILEAWYAGSRGAEAVASVLFGDVVPCAKLPVTFPLRDADIPQPRVVRPRTSPASSHLFEDLAAVFRGPHREAPVQLYYDDGLLVVTSGTRPSERRCSFPLGRPLLPPHSSTPDFN